MRVIFMNIAKLKTFGVSCVCFLLVSLSVSANAANLDPADTGVSVEGWSTVGGHNLPVLTFDEPQTDDEIYQDIRVENFTLDDDGSTRFQLTHSGPMSRQVFAHVRRVEQDDGFTRSIITNIADGAQMEYLTKTSSDPLRGKFDKKGGGSLLTQMAPGEDQKTECPWCPWLGVIITEATCAVSTSIAHYQCRVDCQRLGGVGEFRSGICGMYNSECICMVDPRRIADGANF
jgi:hypothetical protein